MRNDALIFANSIENFMFRLLPYGYHVHSASSAPRPTFIPHLPNDIRTHTMQLSNVAVSSKTRNSSPLPTPPSHHQPPGYSAGSQTPKMAPAMSQYQSSSGNVSSSFRSVVLETVSQNLTPQYQTTTPSGLSLLLANRRAELLSPGHEEEDLPGSLGSSLPQTPQLRVERVDLVTSPPPARALPQTRRPQGLSTRSSEDAPLLAQGVGPNVSYSSVEAGLSYLPKSGFRTKLASASKIVCARSGGLPVAIVRSLPAVLLGSLLNILDGISCESLVDTP